MKYIIIALFTFLLGCVLEKQNTQWEIDENHFLLGFNREVKIIKDTGLNLDGRSIKPYIMRNGEKYVWDGEPGKWVEFIAVDGKKYQTFALIFRKD